MAKNLCSLSSSEYSVFDKEKRNSEYDLIGSFVPIILVLKFEPRLKNAYEATSSVLLAIFDWEMSLAQHEFFIFLCTAYLWSRVL